MKISVIIPTYNYAQYIIEALKSIEKQTYSLNLIEVLIVDDGSTDETPQLFKDYNGVLDLKYFYQKNQGKASATQKGVDLSTGEIIFNLDADDYFYPDKIKNVVSIFKEHPNLTHVGHPADVYKEGKLSYSEEIPSSLLNKPIIGNKLLETFLKKRWLFGGGSTFAAKAKILKNLEIPIGIDMYIDEYLIYASSVFGASYIISKPLSVWRVHGKNYSVDRSAKVLKKKNKRLLDSSKAMLNFVSNSNLYTKQIVRLYELKHIDRLYSSKEKHDEKSISDIFKLLNKIFAFRYSFSDLHAYRIFYRLIPTFIINGLKR